MSHDADLPGAARIAPPRRRTASPTASVPPSACKLPGGYPTLDQIARRSAHLPGRVQRELAEHGVTYKDAVETTRRTWRRCICSSGIAADRDRAAARLFRAQRLLPRLHPLDRHVTAALSAREDGALRERTYRYSLPLHRHPGLEPGPIHRERERSACCSFHATSRQFLQHHNGPRLKAGVTSGVCGDRKRP